MMLCPECGSDQVEMLGRRPTLTTRKSILQQATAPLVYRCPKCRLRFARRTASARFVIGFAIFAFFMTIIASLIYACVRSTQFASSRVHESFDMIFR